MKGWTVIYRGPVFQCDLLRSVLDATGITVELISTGSPYAGLLEEGQLYVPDDQADQAKKLTAEA